MKLTEITERLRGGVTITDDLVGATEAILLTIVSRAASWGASIPNALLVARSASSTFDMSFGLALSVSISLEMVGHALVEHWQSARSWNATKLQREEEMNARLALALVYGYFTVDLVMVGTLALSQHLLNDDWRIFTALLYPLIGVAVAVVTNERARLFRLKTARADRKRARKSGGNRAEATRKPKGPLAEMYDAEPAAGGDTLARARDVLHNDMSISGSALGRKLGISERQGRNLKAEIVGGNGNRI